MHPLFCKLCRLFWHASPNSLTITKASQPREATSHFGPGRRFSPDSSPGSFFRNTVARCGNTNRRPDCRQATRLLVAPRPALCRQSNRQVRFDHDRQQWRLEIAEGLELVTAMRANPKMTCSVFRDKGATIRRDQFLAASAAIVGLTTPYHFCHWAFPSIACQPLTRRRRQQ